MICKVCKQDVYPSLMEKPFRERCRACSNKYRRELYQTKEGKATRNKSNKKWRDKNTGKIREYFRKWYQENGKKRSVNEKKAVYRWQENNVEKRKTHTKIRYAVLKGYVIKPKSCTECKRKVRLQGHHYDYSKPLEVIWLCGSCHKLKHTRGT